jgi:ribosomal protein L12E/L44/L45/RPP1/RPP2
MSAEVDQALEQKDTQDNLVSQAETNVDETIEQVILSRPTSAANVDNSQPTQSLPSPKKESEEEEEEEEDSEVEEES